MLLKLFRGRKRFGVWPEVSPCNLSLQFPVTAGGSYAIEIGGVGQALASIGRVTVLVQVLPTVTILSSSTSLSAGQTTQFTASVTGTPNMAVRWTAQYGTIDANGNYRPPANLTSGQPAVDTVTAISFADPNGSASLTVTVQM